MILCFKQSKIALSITTALMFGDEKHRSILRGSAWKKVDRWVSAPAFAGQCSNLRARYLRLPDHRMVWVHLRRHLPRHTCKFFQHVELVFDLVILDSGNLQLRPGFVDLAIVCLLLLAPVVSIWRTKRTDLEQQNTVGERVDLEWVALPGHDFRCHVSWRATNFIR